MSSHVADKGDTSTLSMVEGFRLLETAGTACARFVDLPVDRAVDAGSLGSLSFPVAVKFDSPLIPHKTEAGLVVLGCTTLESVEAARQEIVARAKRHHPGVKDGRLLVQEMIQGVAECIVGFHRDPVVGPVAVVGTGGVMVELFSDVAMRVLPLAAWDVEDMLKELRGIKLLEGFRGRPRGDVAAFRDLVSRCAALFQNHPEILSLDINPVIVREEGAMIVDALVERRGKR